MYRLTGIPPNSTANFHSYARYTFIESLGCKHCIMNCLYTVNLLQKQYIMHFLSHLHQLLLDGKCFSPSDVERESTLFVLPWTGCTLALFFSNYSTMDRPDIESSNSRINFRLNFPFVIACGLFSSFQFSIFHVTYWHNPMVLSWNPNIHSVYVSMFVRWSKSN